MNYTGGKYKLLPQILPLFPTEINTFVDLFTGGGNIAVNVNANKIIANDNETHVIDIYKAFQNGYDSVEGIINAIESYIAKYNLSIDNTEGFNKLRNDYNSNPFKSNYITSTVLYVLICYSFNHQFRFNSKGEFNMPFGKNRSQWNDTMKKNLINFHKAITEKNIIFTLQKRPNSVTVFAVCHLKYYDYQEKTIRRSTLVASSRCFRRSVVHVVSVVVRKRHSP